MNKFLKFFARELWVSGAIIKKFAELPGRGLKLIKIDTRLWSIFRAIAIDGSISACSVGGDGNKRILNSV